MLNRLTLTLPDPAWESSYRSYHDTVSVRPTQLFAMLGGLAMLAFVPLDPWVVGDGAATFTLVRILLAILLFGLAAGLVASQEVRRRTQVLATATATGFVSAHLWMLWLAGPQAYSTFQAGHVVIVIVAFWGLRVRWTSSLPLILAMSAMDAAALLSFGLPVEVLIVDLAHSALSTTAALCVGYCWERHERLRFLDQLVIEEEQQLLKDMNRALREASSRDPLTGLLNRRSLDERLGEVLSLSNRYAMISSLVFIDLDGFKEVNDRHGHDAGDQVLEAVAEALLRNVRDTDLVFRLGGDEFCLLLPQTRDHQAAALVERILAELMTTEGPTSQVGFSAGCVETTSRKETAAEIMRRADQQLYRAKRSGRSRVCVGNPRAA